MNFKKQANNYTVLIHLRSQDNKTNMLNNASITLTQCLNKLRN